MGLHLYYAASGVEIFGNLFDAAGAGVFINGGRDNHIVNNIFLRCTPAVQITAFGLGLGKDGFAPGGAFALHQKLDAVRHARPPYSTRYPKLAAILDEEPAAPRGNCIQRNIVSGGDAFDLAAEARAYGVIENNFTQGAPGFADVENKDFRLREDSPVFDMIPDFQQLPMGEMGRRAPQT